MDDAVFVDMEEDKNEMDSEGDNTMESEDEAEDAEYTHSSEGIIFSETAENFSLVDQQHSFEKASRLRDVSSTTTVDTELADSAAVAMANLLKDSKSNLNLNLNLNSNPIDIPQRKQRASAAGAAATNASDMDSPSTLSAEFAALSSSFKSGSGGFLSSSVEAIGDGSAPISIRVAKTIDDDQIVAKSLETLSSSFSNGTTVGSGGNIGLSNSQVLASSPTTGEEVSNRASSLSSTSTSTSTSTSASASTSTSTSTSTSPISNSKFLENGTLTRDGNALDSTYSKHKHNVIPGEGKELNNLNSLEGRASYASKSDAPYLVHGEGNGIVPHKSSLEHTSNLEQRNQSNLLLASLLEDFCENIEKDRVKSEKLFFVICKLLAKIGIVDNLSFMDEMSPVRNTYKKAFRTLVNQAIKAVNSEESIHRSYSLDYMPQAMALNANADGNLVGNEIVLQDRGASSPNLTNLEHTVYEEQMLRNSRYREDFIEYGRIGRGGFGAVFKALHKFDQSFYAIKKIPLNSSRLDIFRKVFREVKCLAKLSHPNIIGYNSGWLEHQINPQLVTSGKAIPVKGIKKKIQNSVNKKNLLGRHKTAYESESSASDGSVVFFDGNSEPRVMSESNRSVQVDNPNDDDEEEEEEEEEDGFEEAEQDEEEGEEDDDFDEHSKNETDFSSPLANGKIANSGHSKFFVSSPSVDGSGESTANEPTTNTSSGQLSANPSMSLGISDPIFDFEDASLNKRRNRGKENGAGRAQNLLFSSEDHLHQASIYSSNKVQEKKNAKQGGKNGAKKKPQSASEAISPFKLTLYIQMQLCEYTLRDWIKARNTKILQKSDSKSASEGQTPPISPNEKGNALNESRKAVSTLPFLARANKDFEDVKSPLSAPAGPISTDPFTTAVSTSSSTPTMSTTPQSSAKSSYLSSSDIADNMNIFKSIVHGVQYIHSQGLVHRDLKPSNIFLMQSSNQVKIGDFGLATELLETDANSEFPYGVDETDENVLFSNSFAKSSSMSSKTIARSSGNHTSGVGTVTYASPEQLSGSNYDFKSDIYSLGIIFFELFFPFATQMERAMALRDLRKGILPKSMLVQFPKESAFVLWLTADNPNRRPDASAILEYGFAVSEEHFTDLASMKTFPHDNMEFANSNFSTPMQTPNVAVESSLSQSNVFASTIPSSATCSSSSSSCRSDPKFSNELNQKSSSNLEKLLSAKDEEIAALKRMVEERDRFIQQLTTKS